MPKGYRVCTSSQVFRGNPISRRGNPQLPPTPDGGDLVAGKVTTPTPGGQRSIFQFHLIAPQAAATESEAVSGPTQTSMTAIASRHVAALVAVVIAGACGHQLQGAGSKLPTLNIDTRSVVAAGFGHSGDFAHQFHVAFSATVSGACVFAGQPFNCAVSHFAQDTLVAKTRDTRVPNCQGCMPGKTLPFDHCKVTPHVVDVGSLVDYPRRCGTTPPPLRPAGCSAPYAWHPIRCPLSLSCAEASAASRQGATLNAMGPHARALPLSL